jgi:hypothetical protein
MNKMLILLRGSIGGKLYQNFTFSLPISIPQAEFGRGTGPNPRHSFRQRARQGFLGTR